MYDSDEEIEGGTSREDMAEDVQAGDNVACILDNLDDPFWLMLVDKPCTIVLESFTNGWINSFEPGDVVIRGF
jgi:hypothetical protein